MICLDSNVYVHIIKSIVLKADNHAFRLYSEISETEELVVDESEYIRTEIGETLSGSDFEEFLEYWWAAELEAGRINLIPSCGCVVTNKALRLMGMQSKDRRILCFAIKSLVTNLVSDDIDWFDPKMKMLSGSKRRAFMMKRNGQVARYLRKRHKITLNCSEGFLHNLAP